jgi:cell division protease FtsH
MKNIIIPTFLLSLSCTVSATMSTSRTGKNSLVHVIGLLGILAMTSAFPLHPIPSPVQGDYMRELEVKSNDAKIRRLRKGGREWRSSSSRHDDNNLKNGKIRYIKDLDDFGSRQDYHNDDGGQNVTSLSSPQILPNQIFIPLSRMSAIFQNHTWPQRSSSTTSENDQFRMEKVDGLFNFTSIGGYTDIKEELAQVLDFVKFPDEYEKYGVRLVKGLLLEGPPGNGKTLMARCFAGEANMNFVTCSGAEFNEKYVGVGASRVRELFTFVQKNEPCILFIDEVDALARKRGDDDQPSNGERDQTLNQLLVLMDGFHSDKKILVIGATNRVDTLDNAILRPGRFDKIIHIPNPDATTRREIIDIHVAKKPVNASTDEMVRLTKGFSGAQIENLLNEATLYGIRHKSLPVDLPQLEHIRERMIVGQTSNLKRNMTEATSRRIAIHEVGHLLMALQSPSYERPLKVTIDSLNPKSSLGYTMFESEEIDDGIYLREYLQDKIKVLLGGRAAEEIAYGKSVSTGALSDLEKAMSVARAMIMDHGMGRSVINPSFSETYKKRIDEQIHRLVHDLYQDTVSYLSKNRALLDIFVEHLIIRRSLSREDIADISSTYEEYTPHLFRRITFEDGILLPETEDKDLTTS